MYCFFEREGTIKMVVGGGKKEGIRNMARVNSWHPQMHKLRLRFASSQIDTALKHKRYTSMLTNVNSGIHVHK